MAHIFPAGTDHEHELNGSDGTVDGTTTIFIFSQFTTMTYYPNYADEIEVRLNGVPQTEAVDYTLTIADYRPDSTVVFNFVVADSELVTIKITFR